VKTEYPVIKGEKVYLRPTVESDLVTFAEWESRPEVQAFFTMNYDRSLKDVASEVHGRAGDPGCADFTVCALEDDRLLGRVYISAINHHYDSMDISRIYIGDLSERGKGYGEDALRCALDLGFGRMGMERITLDYVNGNDSAHALYLKVGFRDEGRMRNAGKKNGGYVDLNLMSILRDEYAQNL
jgi:RimJ/RimL family protein N-acetyltransferase